MNFHRNTAHNPDSFTNAGPYPVQDKHIKGKFYTLQAFRLNHPFLVINAEMLADRVKHVTVRREIHGARHIHHLVNILLGDFAVLALYRNSAAIYQALYMAS